MDPSPPESPPFDTRWLELAVEHCRAAARGRPRLDDVYLERRLEVRLSRSVAGDEAAIARSEGIAARWLKTGRRRLLAATGLGRASLVATLGAPGEKLAEVRRVPEPELDPPRGWLDRAAESLGRLQTVGSEVVLIQRQGVVIRPGGWTLSDPPTLVRARRGGGGAVLAVWNHPHLGAWLEDLAADPPGRTWAPDPGERPAVVLGGSAAAALVHEVVGHLVEGDLMATGDSPLTRLPGAAIAPPGLEVVDDPTRRDLPGAFRHDDEGEPAQATTLVHGGRLVGLLCDREWAERLGARGGRGRRASWDAAPAPRMSNLLVRAGDHEPAELERGLGQGLVVTRVAGASVDPTSGRLVLRVERGWELRGGRRRRPLAPCELTGDAVEVLSHLEPTLGNDPTVDQRLGWCVKHGQPLATGAVAPTLVVHRLEVL